tara:strand:- start:688 stop:1377 length:690 start_codon:yes stop_codon:yes gene_type:complete
VLGFNFIKIIKNNIIFFILVDYLVKKLSISFESHYKVVKYLNKKPVVLDLGSHVGQSIKEYLKYDISKIYSFEPDLGNYLKIKKKFKSKVKVYNVALSNREGYGFFYTPYYKNYAFKSWSSVKLDELKRKFMKFKFFSLITFKEFKVKYKTIDSFNIKPHLIKIDTEGGELEILQGAINTLKENKPIITIEKSINQRKIDNFLKILKYKRMHFDLKYYPGQVRQVIYKK